MQIHIKNISKNYGAQQALNNVTFSLSENMILGLLGPNGAGKTTLLKILTGLIKEDEGQVIIKQEGEEINLKALKKNFGYLQENNPLYYHMYVREYLEFVAKLRKLPFSSVENVINKVGLNVEQHKKIENLSKGYKQRVGLAQAIIHEPDLIILDEPTNGLDPNQIVEIRNVIKDVGKGKTIIMSTHLMQEVEALCTNVVLLNRGQLITNKSINEFKGKHSSLEDAFQQIIK